MFKKHKFKILAALFFIIIAAGGAAFYFKKKADAKKEADEKAALALAEEVARAAKEGKEELLVAVKPEGIKPVVKDSVIIKEPSNMATPPIKPLTTKK